MRTKFSIKDLEKLSGIKAHTLRIWEQRYNILKPERTDTNIRSYSNDELKLLLNIILLYNNGYKISKIASLNKTDLLDEVNKVVESQSLSSNQIDSLIISMVEIDEQHFEKIISTSILRNGFSFTIEKIVYPFLQKIGTLWQTDSINPAQEHFISNLIRQKLIVAIDGIIPSIKSTNKKFVLYLTEGELHEISLLYYCYCLKAKGHQVIYLGQSVPLVDLVNIIQILDADYILSVFTNMLNDPNEYVGILGKTFSKQKLLLSGRCLIELKNPIPKNVKTFRNSEELIKLI